MFRTKHIHNDSKKNNGSFTERMLPENTFSLGDDVFVSCNMFQGRIKIHIRRYKKFGATFYPSPDGVTLTPYQFITLAVNGMMKDRVFNVEDNGSDASSLPESDRDTPSKRERNQLTTYSVNRASILDEETSGEIQVEFKDTTVMLSREITCESGRNYARTISMSYPQWETLFSVKDSVTSIIINLKFENVSLVDLYELVTKSSLPTVTPTGMSGLVDQTLRFLLRSAFCKQIATECDELYNPYEEVDEKILSRNTVENFNAAALKFKLYLVLEGFHKRVSEYPSNSMLGCPIIDYVTVEFMSSVHIGEMIEKARDAFCMFSLCDASLNKMY